jgi:hypothetical protein
MSICIIYFTFCILQTIHASLEKKGQICPEVVLWKIDDWNIFVMDYYVMRWLYVTPTGGFACYCGSVWGLPALCSARVRIGKSPPYNVISVIIIIMLHCLPCCHNPIDNISIIGKKIYLDFRHTHTHKHKHIWGEITEGQRGTHRRNWTHYQTLLEV